MVGGPIGVAEAVRQRFSLLAPNRDERRRRLLVAAEALALGRGGIGRVATWTGVSRGVVQRGIAELQAPDATPPLAPERVRQPGAGRKRTVATDRTLRQDLERLVDPVTRGDPESPLRWTSKSLRKLAAELQQQGHAVSHRIVGELLHDLGDSLQANRKTLEGGDHPDRDAQFAHLNDAVQA